MSNMLAESQEAPARIQDLMATDGELYRDLGARLRKLNPAFVGTIARGSSDHAANYAAYLIPQCTGRVVASIPPSVVTVLKSRLQLKDQFVLSISQSGESPDIVEGVGHARAQGALTAAIVNVAGSPLTKTAEVVLPQRAGIETSVAATKTVLCTMASVARIVGEWAEDARLLSCLEALPETLRQALASSARLDEHIVTGVSDAFILSRSLGSSIALETALKLKETCGLHAEGFSTAEVRHGPKEIVDDRYLIIALALPGSGGRDVVEAALELKAQGARVIVVGSKDVATSKVSFVTLPEVEDERLTPLVCLQLLLPWIAKASNALGRNPDQPRYLKSKVVRTR